MFYSNDTNFVLGTVLVNLSDKEALRYILQHEEQITTSLITKNDNDFNLAISAYLDYFAFNVNKILKERKISKSKMAVIMNTSKAYISNILQRNRF